MAHSMATLTQSKFYSPSLNSAIFDGPFKIYFAQDQEPQGLTAYFQIQKKLDDLYKKAKDNFKSLGFSVFIMLYPDDESFNQFIENKEDGSDLFQARVNEHLLIGVHKEMTDAQYDFLKVYLKEKLETSLLQAPI